MRNNGKCTTVSISDAPEDIDAFSGAHRRVAQAVVDVVKNDQGGKTIGLEGPWGSGKSTVVRLISAQLDALPEFTVIVFNAWAHEGDPLRRSFLERLIDGIPDGWKDRKEWQRRKDALRQRRSVAEEKNRPVLTPAAIRLGFAALPCL